MVMTIRFHLDESVSTVLVRALREREIEVSTPVDARLLSATDEEHLAFGRSEGRVVITHDDDFLRLHTENANHAGIVYCHQDKYRIGEFLGMILLVCNCYSAEEIQGQVVFL